MKCDVAIIGAGPYGLSAAAHLKTIKGLDVRLFGEPMTFWERCMPQGMFLRSGWSATHIASPGGGLALEDYQKAAGRRFSRPVPLDEFINYGKWWQRQAVPDADPRNVERLERSRGAFRLTLVDGETVESPRVVVACGIQPFAYRPAEFRYCPTELVSHASEHRDFKRFAGKLVIVIGGGQSALESAALLKEAGAAAEVFARTGRIHWLQGRASTALHYRMGNFTRRLLYAPTDVGPAGVSQLAARPDLLRKLPRIVQDRLRRRAVRPAGSGWLKKRLSETPITLGRSIESAVPSAGRVRLRFDDRRVRYADHVLLGTGYRVDISKYDFLDRSLLDLIETKKGYPALRPGLETSAPGLYILGAPAAYSFGPLLQFVSGAGYASRALVRSIAKEAQERAVVYPAAGGPSPSRARPESAGFMRSASGTDATQT